MAKSVQNDSNQYNFAGIEEVETLLKLSANLVTFCIHNRRLWWVAHLEIAKNTWSKKCKSLKVAGSLTTGWVCKTWREVIKMTWKVGKLVLIKLRTEILEVTHKNLFNHAKEKLNWI